MSLYSRIALWLGGFLAVAGVVHWTTSDDTLGGLLIVLAALCATYLGLFARRIVRSAAADLRAEGSGGSEAEPHVGPTIWPFVFSLASIGFVLGALVNRWLLTIGGALFALAAAGWFVEVRRQWATAHDRSAGHGHEGTTTPPA